MTGLVALIWIVSLPFRLDDGQMSQVGGDTQAAGAISQFFQDMKANISDTWEDSRTAMEELSAETATSTATSTSATSTGSPNATPVLIATSSPREVLVATSTAPNH